MDKLKKIFSIYRLAIIGFVFAVITKVLSFVPVIRAISFLCFLISFLIFFRKVETKRDLFIGLGVNSLAYYVVLLGTYGGIGYAVVFILASIISFVFIPDRLWYKKYPTKLVGVLVYPLTYLTFMIILRALNVGPLFEFYYLFFGMKNTIQIANIVGDFGVMFIALLLVSIIATILTSKKGHIILTSIYTGVIALSLVYGGVTRSQDKSETKSLKVAYSIGPNQGDYLNFYELPYETYKNSLVKACDDAKAMNADLLVFSEECFGVYAKDYEDFTATAKAKALENNLNIIMGLETETNGGKKLGYDQIIYVNNKGEVEEIYNKNKIIPVMESIFFEAGDGVLPYVDINGVKTTFAICYDADFSGYCSKMKDDIDLLVVISWDWDAIADWHKDSVGYRAIENGISIIKVTYDGYTSSYDDLGNIHLNKHARELGYNNTYVTDLEITSKNTIYGVIGAYEFAIYPIGFAVFAAIYAIDEYKNKHKKEEK